MGSLSHKRFMGGGPCPKSNGSDGGPLRKVVGICFVNRVRMECYECGHMRMPKSDLMGETNAVRRRCRYCRDNRPFHFRGEPPSELTSQEYHARSEGGPDAKPPAPEAVRCERCKKLSAPVPQCLVCADTRLLLCGRLE